MKKKMMPCIYRDVNVQDLAYASVSQNKQRRNTIKKFKTMLNLYQINNTIV